MDNRNIEQIRLEELKAEGTAAPDPCEENDRAVRFLAAQTGIGHYDNINLLVMAALLIFTSVLFLAVNSGDNTTADNLPLTAETFLSGEYTRSLSKRYAQQLPIPDKMTVAKDHVALLYGWGNTLPKRYRLSSDTSAELPEQTDPFGDRDRDEDKDNVSEHKVTTTAVVTNEKGETVTTAQTEAGDRSGGTTAVDRPTTTRTDTSVTTTTTSATTTNNDPPSVTTTTTVKYSETETTPTETTSSETTPTETEPPVTQPSETEPSVTEPPIEDSSETPAE